MSVPEWLPLSALFNNDKQVVDERQALSWILFRETEPDYEWIKLN